MHFLLLITLSMPEGSTSSGAPENGTPPVNASYKMTPTEYQSASGPTLRAEACSGAM